MKRPSVESIVAAIKEAYAAVGLKPCRGRWFDGVTACCPGAAICVRSRGGPSGSLEADIRAARDCLRGLLGGGEQTDSGFLFGFDGKEPEPCHNLYVIAERYRPLTDAEYADYLWAFDVGQRVAQELGLTA